MADFRQKTILSFVEDILIKWSSAIELKCSEETCPIELRSERQCRGEYTNDPERYKENPGSGDQFHSDHRPIIGTPGAESDGAGGAAASAPMNETELRALVAPIALYPDP